MKRFSGRVRYGAIAVVMVIASVAFGGAAMTLTASPARSRRSAPAKLADPYAHGPTQLPGQPESLVTRPFPRMPT